MGEATDIKGRVVEFIASQSRPWAGIPRIPCATHPQSVASLPCRHCGKPLCPECAGSEAVCPECLSKRAKAGALSKAAAALRQPAVWVALCIAVSAALYFAGVGNPGVEDIAKLDSGREWHKREAARLILAQGARERRRAVALKLKGDEDGAKRWSLRAADSFLKAASLWEDAPTSFAPALAGAESLSGAGEHAKALEILKSLKAPAGKDDLAAWHFVSGKIADAAGDRNLAKSHFKAAIAAAKEARDSFLESVMSALAGDRRESGMASKVRMVSGLYFTPDEIMEESRKRLGGREAPKDDEDFFVPTKKSAPGEAPGKAIGGGFEVEFLDGGKAD